MKTKKKTKLVLGSPEEGLITLEYVRTTPDDLPVAKSPTFDFPNIEFYFEIQYRQVNKQRDITIETDGYTIRDEDYDCEKIGEMIMLKSIFLRALSWSYLSYFSMEEIKALMTVSEYETELFGSETYNGWDYAATAEANDISPRDAVRETILYCLAKTIIHLDLARKHALNELAEA